VGVERTKKLSTIHQSTENKNMKKPKILRDADRRWGKFHGRDDAEEQIVKVLETAYSKPEGANRNAF
jgi:hypothetical protein